MRNCSRARTSLELDRWVNSASNCARADPFHDREADRGNCPNSPEHSVNASVVHLTPSGGTGVAAAITGGWQLSAIVSARSGSYLTVTTGVDNALSGQPNQRATQVLDDPFHTEPHILAVA